ncbi:hypothetical protein [Singulisphaera sp. PoT]|uniref:hypothetical protein n=1 Tax=Singulisphaera sp. PoT TaxID=3411797 RepID=UPI003BF56CF9
MSPFGALLTVIFVIGVPALILGFVRMLNPPPAQGEWPGHWQISIRGRHLVVGMVLLLLLAWLSDPREMTVALFLAAFLVVGYYIYSWQKEFLFLMGLSDDQLPGRHDKLIWAFALIALGPIGLWVFRSYHLANWPEHARQAGRMPGKPAPDHFS